MRLKPGAKVFLGIVVLVLIGAGVWRMGLLKPLVDVVAPDRKPQGEVTSEMFPKGVRGDEEPPANGSETTPVDNSDAPVGSGKLNRPLRVGIVLYGGFTGGLVANGGMPVNSGSIFTKGHGVEVEFVQIDDLVQMADAFRVGGDRGGIDVMATTVDMFALQYEALQEIKPVTILQTDWSRGADAIAVSPGINSVTDLKGKTIAVAEASPSHFLLLYMLTQGGLTNLDVKYAFTNSAIEAADLFKTRKVDACVSWSPDVYFAQAAVPGSSILASTVDVSNLLAGTLVARGELVERYPESVTAFCAGWFEGVDSAMANPDAAAQTLVDAFQVITADDAGGMMMDVKLADAATNRQFFELDSDAVMGYDDLWDVSSKIWVTIGKLDRTARAGLTRRPSFVEQASTAMNVVAEPQAEEHEFVPPTPEKKKEEPIVTKTISIFFATNSSQLDSNAQAALEGAAELAQTFGSAYIRVSGNTDNVGKREYNVELSRKRAQAVVDHMVKKYGFPADKFIVVGNGPDKPVADNKSDEGKAKNRRTDFEVIPQQ